MDPELKGRMTKYLDALESGITKAGEWAGGEISETIREFVLWRATESFMLAVFFLIAALASALLFRWFARFLLAKSESDPKGFYAGECRSGSLVCRLGQIALPILFVVLCFVQVHRGVKVLVAPRVVLLEEVAGVIKSYGDKSGDKK